MLVLNQRAGFGSRRRGGAPFTTDWKFAGTGANVDVGDENWLNPGNITASNNSRATCESGANPHSSDILRATNFGFTTGDIPAGATILGIEIGIERNSNLGGSPRDLLVILRTSAGQTGDDKASATTWPTSDGEAVYGGAADDWNASLSDSDLRDSSFGVELRAQKSSGGGDGFWRVDAIRCRVHGET